MINRKDDAIERMLSGMQGRAGGGVSPDCLDPETLAAWLDQQLQGAALARAEVHAGDCAHCQAMLAAMARTADAGAAPQAAAPAAGSTFWRMLPWAAPLTAAAAAAAVYVAVRPAVDPAAPFDRLRAPAAEQKVEPSREAAPAEAPSAPADASIAAEGARQKPGETRREAFRESAAGPPQPTANAVALRRDDAARKEVLEMQDAARPAVPPAAAPESGPPPLPSAEAPRVPPPVQRRAAADKPLAPDFSKVQRTATAAAPAKSAAALQESVLIAGPGLILTPDPAVRWRVAGTTVQRSTDGGLTWTAQPADVSATLTAGASPSPDVCWIVGNAGTVLRTTDGRTWMRVAFPERADLAAVTATSAEHATVTTADGRTFTTSDAGKTWQRRSDLEPHASLDLSRHTRRRHREEFLSGFSSCSSCLRGLRDSRQPVSGGR